MDSMASKTPIKATGPNHALVIYGEKQNYLIEKILSFWNL